MTELRARGWRTLLAHPLVLGGLLALLAVNVSTVRPAFGVDSSFRVGLTEAVTHRLTFGVDVAWPYGPIGIFGGPTFISRAQLALALIYQFAALAILFAAMVVHLGRLGLRRRWAVVVLAPVALAIGVTENMVAEVTSLAVVLVLVVLWQDDRPDTPAPSAWWVVAIAGFVAGAQVLVKFGPGAVACGVVIIFALSAGQRVRQALVAVAAIAAGFLAVWFATGQSASALGPYFRTSMELSTGYQEAQAFNPRGLKLTLVGLLALAATLVGVFGAYRWARKDWRALWAIVPVGISIWFILKQGLVRWDEFHALSALLVVALLVAALPWERKYLAAPVVVLLVAAALPFAIGTYRLRSFAPDRVDVAIVLLSGSRQATEVAASRAEVRDSYAVPDPVVEALAGRTVHAEPWDINAVWGNDLTWNPLPVLQSYAAYTVELDNINADRYASGDGPDGVLFLRDATDGRYDLWESPDARLALTCNFEAVASGNEWTALHRAPDVCGPARELRTERVAPGTSVDVPEPSNPDSIVVARFDLPSDPIGQLLSAVARPLRFPRVTIDDTNYRLVTGTAENAHIVRSPGRIGGRLLPDGRVEHSTLSFSNVGSGDIVVRFEEIPLEVP